jgi:hypothetical protein
LREWGCEGGRLWDRGDGWGAESVRVKTLGLVSGVMCFWGGAGRQRRPRAGWGLAGGTGLTATRSRGEQGRAIEGKTRCA